MIHIDTEIAMLMKIFLQKQYCCLISKYLRPLFDPFTSRQCLEMGNKGHPRQREVHPENNLVLTVCEKSDESMRKL